MGATLDIGADLGDARQQLGGPRTDGGAGWVRGAAGTRATALGQTGDQVTKLEAGFGEGEQMLDVLWVPTRRDPIDSFQLAEGSIC